MKLRIKGNSLRLRVTQSDVATLLATGRVGEIIYLAAGEAASLTYALEMSSSVLQPEVLHQPSHIAVALPNEMVRAWAEGAQVGIYEQIEIGARGPLVLIVEKDFACLDVSDEENEDTFPNPLAQAVC